MGITEKNQESALKEALSEALTKINGTKENDICHYLPVEAGGYMHHFTFRKMKTEEPQELLEMIETFILNPANPKEVPPKPRATRGSRKRRDQIFLSKHDLDHVLKIAKLAGDSDLIRKLTPKRDLRSIKRELIASIRHSQIDHELWNSYCEALNAINAHLIQQEGVQQESGNITGEEKIKLSTASLGFKDFE